MIINDSKDEMKWEKKDNVVVVVEMRLRSVDIHIVMGCYAVPFCMGASLYGEMVV